jgi:two-component system sensor histidine kinase HydH
MRLVEQQVEKRGRFAPLIRVEDIAWLLLLALLGVLQQDRNYSADLVLISIGLFQVVEPRIAFFATRRGQIWALAIKLVLCYLLIGYSHAINSNFYDILLLPIISAATILSLAGTTAFAILACAAYLSYLSPTFINWQNQYISPDDLRILCLHVSFFPVVGLLVYSQARAKREEMRRTEAAAERLTKANRDLRRTQVSLRRSERLAALGQLTAGLAHEVRNPLGTIKASAELLISPATHGKQELIQELSGYIASEVDRTNELVSRFLDFARPLKMQARLSDLRASIEQAVNQTKSRATGNNVNVSAWLPQEPVTLSFDPDLITSAITNLIQNAVDASPPGAEVSVHVEDRGMEILIRVSDQGSGIAQEHMENIFNPFFTTKSDGTGLGLAIVSKIVDEHNGKITVQSKPEGGTTFELLLSREEQE